MSYLDVVYADLDLKPGDYTHQLVEFLVRKKLKITDDSPENLLLDVGAGKGAQAVVFAKYFKVATLDRHDDARATFEKAGAEAQVYKSDFGSEAFPIESNTVDVVFTKSVIEHVENWDHFVSEIHRVLKPGGTAVIMTPNWNSQRVNFYDDPTHIRPYTLRTLDRVLRMTGFDEIEIEDVYQLPFTWRIPGSKIVPWLLRKLPNSWKWRDSNQRKHRLLIRFSKETMLLALATKTSS